MDTVLMVAVVLITLAVVVQGGVLTGMYLMSRRMATKAESLMNESRRLIAPLEAITSNLKTVAEDLTETGKIAHEEAIHIQAIVTEAQNNIREQIAEVLHNARQNHAGDARNVRQVDLASRTRSDGVSCRVVQNHVCRVDNVKSFNTLQKVRIPSKSPTS